MNLFLAVALILSWIFSAFFMYRLLSSRRSVLEKCVYSVVLLVPFVGPLLYLFLSEEVPPQSSLLRNNGPRGAYADAMIAIQASMKELSKSEEEIKSSEELLLDDDGVEPQASESNKNSD